jgi:hypothetical protein
MRYIKSILGRVSDLSTIQVPYDLEIKSPKYAELVGAFFPKAWEYAVQLNIESQFVGRLFNFLQQCELRYFNNNGVRRQMPNTAYVEGVKDDEIQKIFQNLLKPQINTYSKPILPFQDNNLHFVPQESGEIPLLQVPQAVALLYDIDKLQGKEARLDFLYRPSTKVSVDIKSERTPLPQASNVNDALNALAIHLGSITQPMHGYWSLQKI